MKNMLPINDEDDFQPRKSNCKLHGRMKNKMASKHCSDSERSRNKNNLHTPLSYSLKRVTRRCENNSEISLPSSSQSSVQVINNDMRKPKADQLEREMKTSDVKKLTFTKDTYEQGVMFINSVPDCKTDLKSPASADLSTDNCSVHECDISSVGPCDENIEIIQEIKNESEKEQDRNNMKTSSSDSSSDKTTNESDSLEKVKNVTAELASDIHSNSYNCVSNSSEETFKSFSCPLCWKTFEKNQAQIGHMKICAARHNMTTRQLLDAIKLQERQAGERRAMGLPHIPVVQTTKKSVPKKTGGSGSDGNLQLALALSASLQEAQECEQLQQDDCLLEAGLGHEVVERQKMMLERFGFTSSRPAILPSNNPRSRPSSKNNITSVLKRRTKEERERLVTEKVAIILMEDENKLVSDSSHTVEPISTSERLQQYQITTPLLWDKVSCTEKEQRGYYVRDLLNFISPNKVDVGVKLKHFSQVPGRIKTPRKKLDAIIAEKDPYSSSGMKAGPLKEMDERLREPKSRSCLGGLPSEQYADKSTFIETVVNDWKCILNKKTMSDLTIYVEKDEEIPAHKLVFYTRCRSILEDIVSEINVEGNNETSEMLLWVDISYQAALAFLQFVYCGLTSKFLSLDEEDMLSVKKLAQRYQVLELVEHLKIVGRQNRVSNCKDLNSSLLQKQSAVHKNITQRKKNKTSPCNKLKCASTPQTVHLEKTSEKPVNHSQAFELDKRKHSVSGCIFGEGKGMEFDTSEDSEQCSIRSTSPDLFVEDVEQSDERIIEEPSQESTNNRNYLLSMINKLLSTQSSPRKKLSEKFSQMSPTANCPKASPKVSCSNSSSSGNNNNCSNNSHSFISCESSTGVREGNIEINSSLLNYSDQHNSTDSDIISEPNGSCNNSPMRKKVQKNLLENLHESQPETGVNPLTGQNSHADTKEVETSFNRIEFFENLLSDSFSPQKKLNQTSMISKRKHSGSDSSSKCSSATKKLCRNDVSDETVPDLWEKMTPEDKKEKSEELDNDIIKSFTTNAQTEMKEISGREHLQNGSADKQHNSCKREMCRKSMGNKRRFEAYDVTEMEGETSTSKEFDKEKIEIFDLTQSSTDSEDENINPRRSKCVEPEPQGISSPRSICEERGSQNSSPQSSICEGPGLQDSCPPRSTYEGPHSQDISPQKSSKELLAQDLSLRTMYDKPQELCLRRRSGSQPQLQWSSPLRGLSPPRCMQDEVVIHDVNQQKKTYKKDEPESQDLSSPRKMSAAPEDLSSPRKMSAPPEDLSSPRKMSAAPEDLSSPRKMSAAPEDLSSPRKMSAAPEDLSSPRKMSAAPEDLSSPRNMSVEPQDLHLPRNTHEELEFNTVDSDDDDVVFMSNNSDKEVEEHSKSDESNTCNGTVNNKKMNDGNRILDVTHAENDLGNFPGIECQEQEFSTVDSDDDTVAFINNNRDKEVEDHSKSCESSKCSGTTNKDEAKMMGDTDAENDWNSFDELCNAAVPHIFSQCLTTLLLTKHTSPATKTMSGKSNEKQLSSLSKDQIEEDKPGMNSSHSSSLNRKPCKSKRELSFKTPNKKTSENRGTPENCLIAELNESVFWRDENEPVLQASPRKSLLTSKYGDYTTPTQQGKKNAFPDKITPPADYSAMKTPQLKKELKRYGLKPSLTRKQAKTMLRHIYDQLHPYITVSDTEESTETSNEELSQFKKPDSRTQVPRSPVKKGSIGKISGSPVRRNIMNVQDVHQRNSFKSGRNLRPQSDIDSDSDMSSSQESSSSSTMDIAEEMFYHDSETFSQKVSSSQDACSTTDLATRVHHFIISDPELHQKVLLYEPIWIEKLHADLKANNCKFKLNQLMDYLDEQCITFRSARGHQNRQRKKLKQDAKKQNLLRRKRGKKKCPAGKSSPSTAMNSSNKFEA